jgi:serine/threonine protein kinase
MNSDAPPDANDMTVVSPGPSVAAHPFLSPPEAPDEVGRLGAFRVLAELGRGGMGVVFRAEEIDLKRLVALKVMLPSAASDAQAVARFRREAEAQAKVEHDHVIVIHRVGEANGVPFIAMPLLKGQTLAAALRQNPRPPLAEVARIGAEMAEGLTAAHAVGLVHRDIKPANVWLEGGKRRVKILDFGLARVYGVPEPGSVLEPTSVLPASSLTSMELADTQLTAAGSAVGTPAYMSPEQARGQPTDSRTDLFSLGVVLYEMATGGRPFIGPTPSDVMVAVAAHHPPPAHERNPDVPIALSELIGKLLAKDVADRPSATAAVADELTTIGHGLAGLPVVVLPVGVPNPWADLESSQTDIVPEPVPSRPPARSPAARRGPRWLWPAVGLVCAAAIAAVVVATTREPKPKPTPEPVVAPAAVVPVQAKTARVPTPAEVLTSPDWVWTEPENLGPGVNGSTDESDPALSGDGLRLVYVSFHDGPCYLYEARRKATTEPFGDRRRLDALCTGVNTVCHPFLSADGLYLVFVTEHRPGGPGRLDVWESRRTDRDAPWAAPKCLGPPVNDVWDNAWPAISPDGQTLYSALWSKWARGEKAYDLRAQRRDGPGWGAGPAIGPEVNTADPEVAPRPLADGKSFVFSRVTAGGVNWLLAVEREGGWDIRLVRANSWGVAPTFTADGRTVVFAADRPGGHGKSDLWQVRLVPKANR